MQAWLQPMQARMSSVCPARASAGISGSQIIALRHHARVGLPGRDDVLRLLRLVDPAGDENGHVDGRAQLPRQRRDVAVGVAHVGGDVVRTGQRGGGPGGHVQVVREPLLGEGNARRERDVGRQPGRVPLVQGDAQARHERGSAVPPDRLECLAQEPKPVLRGAAVLVGAQVGGRVEELRGEVAVAGDDLDAVQARPLQPGGGLPVAVGDLANLRQPERPGHDPEPLGRHRRGGHRHRQRAVIGVHDLPAGVEELPEQRGAVRLDRRRERAVAGDAGVVGRHHDVAGVPGGLVDPGHLDHDQARAAARAGLMVGDEPVGDLAVVGHHGVMAGGDDAVRQGHPADGERAEQAGEHHEPLAAVAVAARGAGRGRRATGACRGCRAGPGG